jgi:hypothetical protein
MGAGMSIYDRVIPLRKAKKSNSESLSHALDKLIEEHKSQLSNLYDQRVSSVSTNERYGNDFASDPNLCRT